MPTGHNNPEQIIYVLARSCHEKTMNRDFKVFGGLSNNIYRHPLHWHGTMFHAIANVTQLAIMDNESLFKVDYDESQYSLA